MIKIAILGRKKNTGNYAGYSSTMSAAPLVTLNPGDFQKTTLSGAPLWSLLSSRISVSHCSLPSDILS